LPFSEYDAGAAYPQITALPPLSNGAPNSKGAISSKAQALRERLANAENDFDAGEDGDTFASTKPAVSTQEVQPMPKQNGNPAHPAMSVSNGSQSGMINPVIQLPHFQRGAHRNVLPQGSMQEENEARAYAPPGWHQRVIRQHQQAQIASPSYYPATSGQAQVVAGANAQALADPQIRKIVELLEARAAQHGGMGLGKGQPDTTTEDLISLAFVGMFFMLAIHALTPPVVYRR
jgi:hypothetical protein